MESITSFRTADSLSSLVLILTGACNFTCDYCYQSRDQRVMSPDILVRALDQLLPHLVPGGKIGFYGGEPLLAMDRIRLVIRHLVDSDWMSRRQPGFMITTNGSLMTPEVEDFFDLHRFTVLLSFDGWNQDIHRQPGSRAHLTELVSRLLSRSGIELEINSVFGPDTVSGLADSLELVRSMGCRRISFTWDVTRPWPEKALHTAEEQLVILAERAHSWFLHDGRSGYLNWDNPDERGVFGCLAGQDRLAVAPDGSLWGCYLFYDWLKEISHQAGYERYRLGRIGENALELDETVVSACSRLRQDDFRVGDQPCFLCPEIYRCHICPLTSALAGREPGNISPWQCALKRLELAARSRFRSGLPTTRATSSDAVTGVSPGDGNSDQQA